MMYNRKVLCVFGGLGTKRSHEGKSVAQSFTKRTTISRKIMNFQYFHIIFENHNFRLQKTEAHCNFHRLAWPTPHLSCKCEPFDFEIETHFEFFSKISIIKENPTQTRDLKVPTMTVNAEFSDLSFVLESLWKQPLCILCKSKILSPISRFHDIGYRSGLQRLRNFLWEILKEKSPSMYSWWKSNIAKLEFGDKFGNQTFRWFLLLLETYTFIHLFLFVMQNVR